jgi:hypothetical protein
MIQDDSWKGCSLPLIAKMYEVRRLFRLVHVDDRALVGDKPNQVTWVKSVLIIFWICESYLECEPRP